MIKHKKLKQFLQPTLGKLLLTIFIFCLLFIFATPVCRDPMPESWHNHPDGEYWGCHSELHRYAHFIPDWPIYNGTVSFFMFLIIAYFLSSLICLGLSKLKNKL
jgi:hypothetical protein